MPINPNLLISAPMLQDYLVDKDGKPMSGGTVTLYQDDSRTTLKNWYYQSGTPGNYTYITLPNPLTLSAAGTITDANGVDTLPFYYPYSELDEKVRQPYYITIVNHAQTNQITRANFPFNPGENSNNQEGSVDNYIINNVFWRNIGTQNLSSVTKMIVAPDQHDGFQYPDIQFIKNNTSATETLTFTKFTPSNTPALTGDITPEFYINHDCTGLGTGETQKCYQFPISLHLATLTNVSFTATIQAQNIGGTGTGQNVIQLFILQDTGSGTTPPVSNPIGTITLNTAWTKYEFTSIFPSDVGLTLSNGGDDAFYLQVQMPLNAICNINFTKPSIYLSTLPPPTNSFITYDEVDAVINSPRTGDIRTSMNQFYYYGWVPMNDGTIGNASSNANARANVDTWPLYNLLWGLFNPYPVASFPIYTSGEVLSTYGANAYADWNANKALGLSKMMGRVIMGDVPLAAALSSTGTINYWQSTIATVTDSGAPTHYLLITTTQTTALFMGAPVIFSNTGGALPTGIAANTIYYIVSDASFSSTTFHIATTYVNALAGTAITYTDAGSGTNTVSMASQGAITGEYFHTQLAREVGIHNHPGSSGNFLVNAAGNTFTAGAGAFNFTTNANTGNNSGGAPFNITQPSVLYNMFIKL